MTDTIVTQENNMATIRPASDLVAAAGAELRSTFRKLLEGGVREVTVDFSGVAMIDSAGIGLLVAAHNSLAKIGGHLAIEHASVDILELLTAMRIHQHFRVSGD